jgi:hypothetical protein
MSDIILVHGAWHGGWCWRYVADDLRARGHRVFTPSLGGMGDRAHLLGSDTGIESHAADIMGVATAEEVSAALLVCHSYAGLPGVQATAHAGIGRLLLLDAVAHEPGRALLSGAPAAAVAAAKSRCVSGGLALPPDDPAAYGVPADHPLHGWVKRRLSPLPWRCLADALPPLPARYTDVPRSYAVATGNTMPGPRRGFEQAQAAGWPIDRIESGHDLPITAPVATAALIDRLARQTSA